MVISGKNVALGNELWHMGFRQWATVVQDTPHVIVELTDLSGRKYSFVATEGGLISGRRQLYWHQPLVLDVPDRDISKYQSFVDTLTQVLRK